jgi:hypothetical protein
MSDDKKIKTYYVLKDNSSNEAHFIPEGEVVNLKGRELFAFVKLKNYQNLKAKLEIAVEALEFYKEYFGPSYPEDGVGTLGYNAEQALAKIRGE